MNEELLQERVIHKTSEPDTLAQHFGTAHDHPICGNEPLLFSDNDEIVRNTVCNGLERGNQGGQILVRLNVAHKEEIRPPMRPRFFRNGEPRLVNSEVNHHIFDALTPASRISSSAVNCETQIIAFALRLSAVNKVVAYKRLCNQPMYCGKARCDT